MGDGGNLGRDVEQRGFVPLIDSVRAIAALLVLVRHASANTGALASGSALAPLVARLDVGVTVFFVLSGYLLYKPFIAAHADGVDLPSRRSYLWRRVLRIVPAYWLALTAVVILGYAPGVLTATGIPTFYGFAQIYTPGDYSGGISVAWSLCVEITFYAFLPLFAMAVRRASGGRSWLRGEIVGLTALIAFSVAYKVIVIELAPHPYQGSPLAYLPRYLDWFAVGMVLAVVHVRHERTARLPAPVEWVARVPWLGWAVAGAALLLTTRIGLPDGPSAGRGFQFFERHLLYAVVGAGLLVPAVFGRPGRSRLLRVLAHPGLLYLGLISYGIYL